MFFHQSLDADGNYRPGHHPGVSSGYEVLYPYSLLMLLFQQGWFLRALLPPGGKRTHIRRSSSSWKCLPKRICWSWRCLLKYQVYMAPLILPTRISTFENHRLHENNDRLSLFISRLSIFFPEIRI